MDGGEAGSGKKSGTCTIFRVLVNKHCEVLTEGGTSSTSGPGTQKRASDAATGTIKLLCSLREREARSSWDQNPFLTQMQQSAAKPVLPTVPQ